MIWQSLGTSFLNVVWLERRRFGSGIYIGGTFMMKETTFAKGAGYLHTNDTHMSTKVTLDFVPDVILCGQRVNLY